MWGSTRFIKFRQKQKADLCHCLAAGGRHCVEQHGDRLGTQASNPGCVAGIVGVRSRESMLARPLIRMLTESHRVCGHLKHD